MRQQSIFREKNRLLIQCVCHASDFLDVGKISWGPDMEVDVDFSITVNPKSFWDRLKAVWRAWTGHRYVGGVDVVILEPGAVKALIEFLQAPYEEED